MCVVSMIGDEWQKQVWPDWPYPPGPARPVNPSVFKIMTGGEVTREEFEALKREFEMIRALLERAVEYDKRTNQPHCEQEAKIALIKKVAEALGVDVSFLNED